MNKIQHIYANGCSFTYDNYIKHELDSLCYPEILAQRHSIACTNAGFPGSCNRRIVRNTLRDALALDSSSLVLIQLTFLTRIEKPYTPGQNNEWKMDLLSEEYHESVKDNPREPINQKYVEAYMRFFDFPAEITNLATDIIMLTGYLQSKNISYYIFPYAPLATEFRQIRDNSKPISEDRLLKALTEDTNVMNILTDSLIEKMGPGNWYYDTDLTVGHLNAQGHHRAAELLDQLITNLPGVPG